MIRSVRELIRRVCQTRGHRRIAQQFLQQGFTEIPCPEIPQILPLGDARILRPQWNHLFEKGDMQILLFGTNSMPASRQPNRGRMFVLLCTAMPQDQQLRQISGALREPSEQFSIVDLLNLDSYPSDSPLPDAMVFAADRRSAQTVLQIAREQKQKAPGSLIVHGGRLFWQVSAT